MGLGDQIRSPDLTVSTFTISAILLALILGFLACLTIWSCSPAVPSGLGPSLLRPGLDPRGPLPDLALQKQTHTQDWWGSPLCLGPELGNLEIFPRLLPHHGEASRKCVGLMDG